MTIYVFLYLFAYVYMCSFVCVCVQLSAEVGFDALFFGKPHTYIHTHINACKHYVFRRTCRHTVNCEHVCVCLCIRPATVSMCVPRLFRLRDYISVS